MTNRGRLIASGRSWSWQSWGGIRWLELTRASGDELRRWRATSWSMVMFWT